MQKSCVPTATDHQRQYLSSREARRLGNYGISVN